MLRALLIFCIAFLLLERKTALAGPYAPAAGQPGSKAILMDDYGFVGWASGWEDYIVGSEVDSGWQTPEKALGKAVGDSYDVVALGRGGQITMTFNKPIMNGDGYDFAVFENAISDTFLELAYVEVSSDGTHFFRFDNDSRTTAPVATFGTLDPTDVTGYGGKYRQGYGTPFDLADLAFDPLLDVMDVGWVRIVDILGDGTYTDTTGDVIYDPYPTIGSAGFDLDAVGVINAVPVPGAFWLFFPGILTLIGLRKARTF
ncbi:MAG: PEP-CTERM sorting domain-containing protein [Deltaproteobacteria bacterium]|nr:PEP-CTERM sorting domain-containing protein [Deltaproteobacteria bacterium]